MAINRVSSILAADFGSVQTRVVLFDVVDGEYRLVAHASGRTTLGYPDDDLNVGLRRLLGEITQVTGRQFYNQIGRVVTPEDRNRNGVDFFVTTASAGRPIRVIVVGLIPEISIASALRAMSGTYVETAAEFHLRDGYTEEERLNALILGRPDLIFIAGGTDDGADNALKEIISVVALALKVQDSHLRPPVLYAGNKSLQGFVTENFADLTEVLISDNIRPSMSQEDLDSAQTALGRTYDEHRETHGVAFATVGEMSSTGLLPTAQSYSLVANYLSKTHKMNMIAVDMGSTSTILVGAFNGQVNTQISTTKGLGQSAITLLDDVGEDNIAKWLPYYPVGSEIRNYALNKLARPASIPMNLRDLFMEQAMMRVAMQQMMTDGRTAWKNVAANGLLPQLDRIIVGGGALLGTGNLAYDMMLIADCIQPTGVTEIKADRHGVIPAMSALAHAQPDAVVQILDGNSIEHLGTLISLEGQTASSNNDVIAELRLENIDDSETTLIRANSVLSLPVPNNFELKIKIKCKRGFKINGKSRLKLTTMGSVLIDARGRSLQVPATVEERMRLLPQWIAGATDDPIMELPEDWAFDTNEPDIEEEEAVIGEADDALFDEHQEPEGDMFADVDDDATQIAMSDDELDNLFGEDDAEDDLTFDDDDDFDSLRDLMD